VRFPRLLEKYPFPVLINTALLKLAEVFRQEQQPHAAQFLLLSKPFLVRNQLSTPFYPFFYCLHALGYRQAQVCKSIGNMKNKIANLLKFR
jgi:hypothetical protein